MSTRPSGTVTFLFTDIEGSMKLAQEYPDEMPVLLTWRERVNSRRTPQAQTEYENRLLICVLHWVKKVSQGAGLSVTP